MRREDEDVGRRVMALEVQGMRGRPKQRWTDIKEDMKEKGIRGESRRRTELCGGDSSSTSTPREVGYDAAEGLIHNAGVLELASSFMLINVNRLQNVDACLMFIFSGIKMLGNSSWHAL